jgi:predicted O-linked N-acetylglucosamine transferase (SPINDLY family)
LIAQTPEQYVRIGEALANDQVRRDHLRHTLRKRMESSPLMDAKRFARDMESAYLSMWEKWCAQRPAGAGHE